MTIPLSECKHGYLYRISSRNLAFGVFDSTKQGFVGIREKFGHRYLFTEFHYDTGAPFGTVRPKELLEICPIVDLAEWHSEERDGTKWAVTNQPLFDWLNEQEGRRIGYYCRIRLIKEEEGYSAIVLNLPGAASCGDTDEEAINNVREAITGCIESYRESNVPIPWKWQNAPEGKDIVITVKVP
jgi:predicted RNase H-like HicB family nuclease